jgi:hypothetical protein
MRTWRELWLEGWVIVPTITTSLNTRETIPREEMYRQCKANSSISNNSTLIRREEHRLQAACKIRELHRTPVESEEHADLNE